MPLSFSTAARLSACALALFAGSAANAVDVTGGEVALGYSFLTDESSLSTFSFDGSLELGFNRNFGLQFDIANHSFGFTETSANDVVIHGIYHVDETLSLGAFYLYEEFEGLSTDAIGLEVGKEFAQFDLEAYVATDDDSFVFYGVEGQYNFQNGVFVGLDFDALDDAADRLALQVGYDVANGIELAGEFGSFDSEAFLGMSVAYKFGAERGSTFGERTVLGQVPGL